MYPELVTLKLARNQIANVSDVLTLTSLQKLESLDLSENPFCASVSADKNEYQDKMRDLLKIEALYLLDGHDKDGESLESEESGDEDAELDSQEDEDENDDGQEESEEEDDAGSDEDEAEESEGETDETGGVQKPKAKRMKAAADANEESNDDEIAA